MRDCATAKPGYVITPFEFKHFAGMGLLKLRLTWVKWRLFGSQPFLPIPLPGGLQLVPAEAVRGGGGGTTGGESQYCAHRPMVSLFRMDPRTSMILPVSNGLFSHSPNKVAGASAKEDVELFAWGRSSPCA
jgi:hypothetical protein